MLGSLKFKMAIIVENAGKILFLEPLLEKSGKSSYKIDGSDLIKFNFESKFEWDFENHRNSVLVNQK